MLKKRYLLILGLIVLLFILGAIVPVKSFIDEHSPMVEVCRNALSSDRPGYTFYECGIYNPLRYERTTFSYPDTVTVHFTDGINDMQCEMQRRGSKWVVTGRLSTLAAPCP